jgi:hypothetical protein
MNTDARTFAIPTVLFVLAGCVVEQREGEAVGTAESAAITSNAITSNAITSNAITSNAITSNAITSNAITSNAITSNAITSSALTPNAMLMSALQDPGPTGDLSRMFFQYTVGCALAPTQSVSFSWTDSQGAVHNETYAGSLGVATEWATGPLNESGQKIVSACLASRTNWYGVHVAISLRSSYDAIAQNTTTAELAAYPYVEGAFWGNLFAPTPYLNTCYNTADVAHSRAAQRDCAAGHVNADGTIASCGMINIVGPCSSVCWPLDAGGAYPFCLAHPGTQDYSITTRVITTALP